MDRSRRGASRILASAGFALLMVLTIATPALASNVYSIKKISKGSTSLALDPHSQTKVKGAYVFESKSAKITNVASSNTKVVKVSTIKDGKVTGLVVQLYKPGKAKVSYTLKGKKHRVTIVARKWEQPVKKLMVGSRNVASKFKKSTYLGYTYAYEEPIGGKLLTVTPSNGWKIKSISCLTYSGTPKRIKNGTTVAKNTELVLVTLVHKKTGTIEEIAV